LRVDGERRKLVRVSKGKRVRLTPSFAGLSAASLAARRAARGASKKTGTKCEVILRRAMWAKGLRYRLISSLPGKPDVVFVAARVAVFCDGDFWHGRDLNQRIKRLAAGHNAQYWVAKIRSNVERDRFITERLEASGWRVLRLWETDIRRDPDEAAAQVEDFVFVRQSSRHRGGKEASAPAEFRGG
jgi:DNA mismatch endonuclease, patch repair protein